MRIKTIQLTIFVFALPSLSLAGPFGLFGKSKERRQQRHYQASYEHEQKRPRRKFRPFKNRPIKKIFEGAQRRKGGFHKEKWNVIPPEPYVDPQPSEFDYNEGQRQRPNWSLKGLFGGGKRGGGGGAVLNRNFNSGCRSVKVNCANHTINIDGHVSRIDCGANGATRSGSGTVGGRHSGPKVPDGLKINTPGMRGTVKVFHTWSGYRRNGRTRSYPRGTMPMGRNTSRGCVIVNDHVYAKLKRSCVGKPLSIIGSGGSRGRIPAGYTKRRAKSRSAY